ncbi:hypothetical protein ARMGADRAFT_934806, partial [Armillaria gallica]
ICSSSLCREHFLSVVKQILQKELQVILDTDTRWSSTRLMIDRALILRTSIETFLASEKFQDLTRTNHLSKEDWDLLFGMNDVLSVSHDFQHQLSAEKTPTLCDAIPSFKAVLTLWEEDLQKYPHLSHAIQAGLSKLMNYMKCMKDVPAYTLAMGKKLIF